MENFKNTKQGFYLKMGTFNIFDFGFKKFEKHFETYKDNKFWLGSLCAPFSYNLMSNIIYEVYSSFHKSIQNCISVKEILVKKELYFPKQFEVIFSVTYRKKHAERHNCISVLQHASKQKTWSLVELRTQLVFILVWIKVKKHHTQLYTSQKYVILSQNIYFQLIKTLHCVQKYDNK